MKLDKYSFGPMKGQLFNIMLENDKEAMKLFLAGDTDALGALFAKYLKQRLYVEMIAHQELEKDVVLGPMIKGL